MTDEEIEKQADYYVNRLYKQPNSSMIIDELEEVMIKQTFKDGAKWGMEQICKTCEKRLKELDRPCAYRSLGNDYCWE